jgi:hypothetical protein
VSAHGTESAGVNAHFNLLIDGKKVGEGMASTTAKDFVFKTGIAADQAHKVQVQFDNDFNVNGQDRNLIVNKITINGKAVSPTDSIVTYDKGALDGRDVAKGQSGMWWNGTLVVDADKSFFPAGTGQAAPPQGSDVVAVRVSGDSYKGDPMFRVQADGAQIGGPDAVTTAHGDGYQEFIYHVSLPDTTKTIGIDFFNDYSDGPGLDRNLYVHSVQVNGHEHVPEQEAMMNNGIMLFDVAGSV